MGFQKLGMPIKKLGTDNCHNNNKPNKPKSHGQSYMWRVKIYKKKMFGGSTLVTTKVFTNKVEAMKCQNENNGNGTWASIEKWDPTNKR